MWSGVWHFRRLGPGQSPVTGLEINVREMLTSFWIIIYFGSFDFCIPIHPSKTEAFGLSHPSVWWSVTDLWLTCKRPPYWLCLCLSLEPYRAPDLESRQFAYVINNSENIQILTDFVLSYSILITIWPACLDPRTDKSTNDPAISHSLLDLISSSKWLTILCGSLVLASLERAPGNGPFWLAILCYS